MTKRFVYALLMLSIGTAGSVVAQQLGELSGSVHDAEGAPVEGVGVVAEHGTTGERNSAATDGQGRYRIIALPPGIYTVTASGPGFETMVHEKVRVVADGVTRRNFDQRGGFNIAAPSLERTYEGTARSV